MPVVLRGSAIVAAFTLVALSGCGQSGALYMPTVPPLPAPLDPPASTTRGPAAEAPAGAASSPAASSSISK